MTTKYLIINSKHTIEYAIFVTFSKSFCAPVVILENVIFSAALPPNVIQILSIICSFVYSFCSLGVYWANPRVKLVLGTIVTFCKTSEFSNNLQYENLKLEISKCFPINNKSENCPHHPTRAWPDSWKAITRRSSCVNACDLFSVPPEISMFSMSTNSLWVENV